MIDAKQLIADPDKASTVAKITGTTSVVTGTGAGVGGWMGWIEANSVTLGLCIAAITMVANIIFQWLERKDRLKRYERERKDRLKKQGLDES